MDLSTRIKQLEQFVREDLADLRQEEAMNALYPRYQGSYRGPTKAQNQYDYDKRMLIKAKEEAAKIRRRMSVRKPGNRTPFKQGGFIRKDPEARLRRLAFAARKKAMFLENLARKKRFARIQTKKYTFGFY